MLLGPMGHFLMRIYKKKDMVGVEIGVWKGKNARQYLNNLSLKKLYLVDPYKHYDGYDDYIDADMDKVYNKVVGEFGNMKNITIIRKTSEEAINEIRQIDLVGRRTNS